jgi:hypothetical protein
MASHVERRRETSKTTMKLLCERFNETISRGLRARFYWRRSVIEIG